MMYTMEEKVLTARELKVQTSIQKATNEGYEFLEEGVGSQDPILEKYRAQGYDVRAWYTIYEKDHKAYVAYGRKKIRNRKKVSEQKPDYAKMNLKTLKQICKEQKIAGYSKMNKQQIVEVLAS